MTTFTKTPPTEPVPHYWREHSKAEWKALELFINDIGYLTTNLDDSFQPVEEIGGEWGGRVPAPGETFSVEQIEKYFIGGNFSKTADDKFAELTDPQSGIAAVTERHRKEPI